MGREEAWINEAHATGMFIWATTIVDFVQKNPEECFHILKTREQENGVGRLAALHSYLI